jgi:tRNA (guanine-N7-)-methyltransferase
MELMVEVAWRKIEELPWPVDWPAFFGRPGPLVIEIGFGSGLFLADLARRRPETNVLGLEISAPALRHAARKIERGGLANVRLLQADAPSALQALCAPGSVAETIINFPDPWPKKDHQARRLINDDFLRLLATRMRPGGALDVATDHADYAAQIAAALAASPHFESRRDAPFVWKDEGRVATKYERAARAEGRIPRYFQWRRNAAPAADRYPIPKEAPMPHVVLRLPADLAEIGRRFRPESVELESAIVRYVDVYHSYSHGSLLIETYINEGPVRQRIGLEMRARPSGEIVIALAEIGFPRATPGVHQAIRHLVDRLREAFPSLVVVQTTLQERHADSPHP